MAKVKFSALISEMRNKLNGSVFARNRGGAYLRTKVTPTNPQTAAQVAARSLLTTFSQMWRTLTPAQHLAWNAVVDQWSTTDVFGDVVNPSGSALFIRLNINISLAGGTVIDTPPTPTGAVAISELSIVADASSSLFNITFAPATVPADTAMYVEATPMLSPGISNANSKFRKIVTLDPSEASPYLGGADYLLKFGSITTGQKVFCRAKFINQLTGEVSQSLVGSTIVVA